MQNFILVRQQQVAKPLHRIFSFFEKPENLALITPPSLGFKVLSPTPVEMKLGQVIDYDIHLFGFPIHWRSRISEYDPPHRFVDEQLIGPYGHWHHLHQFTEQGDETIIYDRITYELPSYLPRLFQNIINRVYVTAALQQIFDYRQQVFADIFGSGKNITSPLKN